MRLLLVIALLWCNLILASEEINDDNNQNKKKAPSIRHEVLCRTEHPQKTVIFREEARRNYFQMLIVGNDKLCVTWKVLTKSSITADLFIRRVIHDNLPKLTLVSCTSNGKPLFCYREIIEILLTKFANAGWVMYADPYSDLAKELEALGFTTNSDKRFLTCSFTYTREPKKTLDNKAEARIISELPKNLKRTQQTISRLPIDASRAPGHHEIEAQPDSFDPFHWRY